MPKFKFTLDAEIAKTKLRDRYALQAMTILEPPKEFMGKKETKLSYETFAKRAFAIADAMIKQRFRD